MNKLLTILLIFSFVFTQEPCDGTCYTPEEEQNIELHISTLEQDNKLNLEKIKELADMIKLYNDLVKEVKPKWYENKWLWFSLGIICTAGSVKLAGEIVD